MGAAAFFERAWRGFAGAWCSLVVASVGQIGDLLADQTDQENDHRRTEQQGAHVGESSLREIGVGVVAESNQEEHCRGGHEQLQRRIQTGNLEDDQQKAQSVFQWADVAVGAHALVHRNRQVGHRIGATKKGHGAGGRVGKAVGQQMQELAETRRANGAKARG